MKTMIIAFAAVAALVAPALAHPTMHARGGETVRGAGAQAMAPANANTVYAYGANLGSDPDPQVRLQLLRSAGLHDR